MLVSQYYQREPFGNLQRLVLCETSLEELHIRYGPQFIYKRHEGDTKRQ